MKKIILIIIDGLADEPLKELGGGTPLEAAKTPHLDFMAANGINGLVEPFKLPWEEYPTSETAHLGLFGYQKYFLGRGPYEAAGIGLELAEGDVALRANFATIDRHFKIIDRRAGRISETRALIKSLDGIVIDGVKFLVKKSYGHRVVIVLKGKGLSARISDSDPRRVGVHILRIVPLEKSPEAKFTAEVLNKFLNQAHQKLENHPLNEKRRKEGKQPANFLLTRGAGQLKKVPSFKKKYGLKAVCFAGGKLYQGIARILGMTVRKVKGANGFPQTNLEGKIKGAKAALKKFDFVFVHIKAADTLAEDGDFLGKKRFIEKIDKSLKPLLSLKETLVVVTADHATSSKAKKHCLLPVPLLIFGNGKDGVERFSERACQEGRLGKIKGVDLMPKILLRLRKV